MGTSVIGGLCVGKIGDYDMTPHDLRKMDDRELQKRLDEIRLEIMKFHAVKHSHGEGAIILPTGVGGGVKWGVFKNLKKEKARILTILKEREDE